MGSSHNALLLLLQQALGLGGQLKKLAKGHVKKTKRFIYHKLTVVKAYRWLFIGVFNVYTLLLVLVFRWLG